MRRRKRRGGTGGRWRSGEARGHVERVLRARGAWAGEQGDRQRRACAVRACVEAARSLVCRGAHTRACTGTRVRAAVRGARATVSRAALGACSTGEEGRREREGRKEEKGKKEKEKEKKKREREREKSSARRRISRRPLRPGRPRAPRRPVRRRTRSEEKKRDGTAVGIGCRVRERFLEGLSSTTKRILKNNI